MKGSKFQIDSENISREKKSGNESLDSGKCSTYFCSIYQVCYIKTILELPMQELQILEWN
jgi:hypothetical protein